MTQTVEWKISNKLIDYDFAISLMEKRVLNIKRNSDKELVWLLEHESIYTAGTSAKDNDLINNRVEIRHTGRGGQWTWHGPGQRVVYLMLNLKNRLPDIKAYVYALEELIILSLSDFNIYGVRIKKQPGVWVNTNNRFDKIAALGIRISSWITYHGISINLNPNLEEFKNIVPCGIKDSG
ncbi:lipoyl(octanoyl) transferase LipB, partial [Alphaproteobacteria bacterium]|nr:lipoyl(octanoyl) transferase LipB [Alphaproteobacteria bacterium]